MSYITPPTRPRSNDLQHFSEFRTKGSLRDLKKEISQDIDKKLKDRKIDEAAHIIIWTITESIDGSDFHLCLVSQFIISEIQAHLFLMLNLNFFISKFPLVSDYEILEIMVDLYLKGKITPQDNQDAKKFIESYFQARLKTLPQSDGCALEMAKKYMNAHGIQEQDTPISSIIPVINTLYSKTNHLNKNDQFNTQVYNYFLRLCHLGEIKS